MDISIFVVGLEQARNYSVSINVHSHRCWTFCQSWHGHPTKDALPLTVRS
ncbi:MAG TPA: hypothetical protein VM640_03770 [Desulfitobacterium sp.]|nr:hypothetical protein [Desulfitobacterium sp.]HVJ48245.1 hypothetical protein [Desulfitobacterium sp.]